MKSIAALFTILTALLFAAPAVAAPYTPHSNPSWPYWKVTPVKTNRLLCSNYGQGPQKCNLQPGITYQLHHWTPDWGRTHRENFRMPGGCR